jgi:hypothetical protein
MPPFVRPTAGNSNVARKMNAAGKIADENLLKVPKMEFMFLCNEFAVLYDFMGLNPVDFSLLNLLLLHLSFWKLPQKLQGH